ncbi:MAG: HDOD domain-containing protein [Gemmatimonadaceae bacterium]|nr:HDOD domain-containing protein [Gemmatimonadaceae bacterium]
MYLTRSPLFDDRFRLAGCALAGSPADGTANCQASFPPLSALTPEVVADYGGGSRIWVPLAPDALYDRAFVPGLRDATVLEVPASLAADGQAVAACRDWSDAGFRIAVRAAQRGGRQEQLYSLAYAISFDAGGCCREAADGFAKELTGLGRPLAAVGVDSLTEHATLRNAGVRYFTGRFYTTPEAAPSMQLSVSLGTAAKLMGMLARPDLSDRAIEKELRSDPALSYNLLRMANAASTGLGAIGSILHAIQIVGRNGLQRWCALLAVGNSAASTPMERERRMFVLERARLCELIAEGTALRRHASSLFLTGMLSAMLPMVGKPNDGVVDGIAVNSDVARALAGDNGLYTPVLSLASAYSYGNWTEAEAIGRQLDVLHQLPQWAHAAVKWAREALARG